MGPYGVVVAAGVGIAAAVIFFVIGYFFRKATAEKKIKSAEAESTRMVEEAKKEAEATKKEILVEAKDEAFKIKNDAEREANMNCTQPYVKNAQVVVMPKDKAADYTTVESLKDLAFAVEVESAGKGVAEDNGFNYTELTYQSDAILEVHTGKADACIIDLTMADALTAEGATYENLTKVMSLNEEEYGIGCRKGSDLCTEINTITDKLLADGTLDALAAKYELTLVK